MNQRTYKRADGLKEILRFSLFSISLPEADRCMVGIIPKYHTLSIKTLKRLSDILKKDYPEITDPEIYTWPHKNSKYRTILYAYAQKPKSTYKPTLDDPRY